MSDTSAALDLPTLARPTTVTRGITLPDGTRQQIKRNLKAALDFMVWDGMRFDAAARKAGYAVSSMRKALERSHVRRYLQEQRNVFAANIAAQNLHRAAAIRDQDDNRTAALQAVRWIEEVASGRAASEAGRVSAPGIVINIGAAAVPRSMPADDALIEINPLGDAPEV
jgi:hypothetical protein